MELLLQPNIVQRNLSNKNGLQNKDSDLGVENK